MSPSEEKFEDRYLVTLFELITNASGYERATMTTMHPGRSWGSGGGIRIDNTSWAGQQRVVRNIRFMLGLYSQRIGPVVFRCCEVVDITEGRAGEKLKFPCLKAPA